MYLLLQVLPHWYGLRRIAEQDKLGTCKSKLPIRRDCSTSITPYQIQLCSIGRLVPAVSIVEAVHIHVDSGSFAIRINPSWRNLVIEICRDIMAIESSSVINMAQEECEGIGREMMGEQRGSRGEQYLML